MKLQVSTKFRKRWCRRLLAVTVINLAFAAGTHSGVAIFFAIVAMLIAAFNSI